MAIVSVEKRFEKRGARARIDRGREYEEEYVVATDSVTVGSYEILTAQDPTSGVRIPQPGERHSDHNTNGDEHALVQQVEPVQIANSERFWDVAVNYSTIVAHTQEAAAPLDRTPKYSWGFLTTTEPYAVDALGRTSENTAGVPYDPIPVRTQSIPVLSLRWNTATYSQSLVTSRMDTVNSDMFRIVGYDIPIGQAKLAAWTAEGLSEGGRFFFANSVQLQFRERDPGWAAYDPELAVADPWDHVRMQYGFTQRVQDPGPPATEYLKAILVRAGKDKTDLIQPQDPQRLDENGLWIDDLEYGGAANDVAWKLHQPYHMMPFGVLGLPP